MHRPVWDGSVGKRPSARREGRAFDDVPTPKRFKSKRTGASERHFRDVARPCLALGLMLSVILLQGACADGGGNFQQCAEPSDESIAALPPLLSQAGLFTNMTTETLADRVWPYEPRFKLWSDGATKRRWVSIPAGATVDVGDMDQWRFPQGTKLFKEFTRNGVRVETRIMLKTGSGDDDWSASAYVWAANQSDATLSPEGGDNQLNTPHDVPSGAQCIGCHGGRASRVLGFSAVQLAWDPPEGVATLADFKSAGVLPAHVPNQIILPGSNQDREALGYLHANCSHCHNATRPVRAGPRCYDPQADFDFSYPAAGVATVQASPAYITGVREEVLVPGNAARSEFVQRLSGGNPQMPALGTEVIDQEGRALLTQWVDGL
jgi:hypothetical protein